MESLSELKKKIHKPQINYTSPWYARRVIRYISVFFTWILVQTRITANQVTLFGLVIGIFGLVLLANPEIQIALLGIFLLHLSYVFDCVDGEMARYRKTPSLNGMFLDFLSHEIVIPGTYFAFSLHYYFSTGYLWSLIAGIISLFALINPVGKSRLTTISYLIKKQNSPVYNYMNYAGRENKKFVEDNQTGYVDEKEDMGLTLRINKLRRKLKPLFSYPNDIIIIAILLFSEWFLEIQLPGLTILVLISCFLLLNQVAELYIHLKKEILEREMGEYITVLADIHDRLEKSAGK